MAKPIKFSEVNSVEPLDASRFKVNFPTIQGIDGKTLMLHHAEVSLPNRGIAQVSVKYLGNTANFRGSSQNDNILSVSFIENADGDVTKAIFDWMKLCRNSSDGTSRRKAEYAQPAQVFLFNSKGEAAVTFDVYNMWPMQVTMPQLSDASGPVKYEVQFSIDALSPANSEPLTNANPEFTPSSLSDMGSNLRAGIGSSIGGIGGGGGFNIGGMVGNIAGGMLGNIASNITSGMNLGGMLGGITNGMNMNFGGMNFGGLSGNLGAMLTNNGINLGGGANIGPFNLSLNANVPLPVNALTMSQFTNTFANKLGIFR